MIKLMNSKIISQHLAKPAWYALRTKSRCEKIVFQQLQKRGITAYLPLLSQAKKYLRKIRTTEMPVVPGYVFTFIASNQAVQALEVIHAVSFIKFEQQLAAIPESDIEILRRISGDQIQVSTEPISLEPGMEVTLRAGALAGLKGRIVARKGKQVLLVDFHYLGATLALDVDQHQLQLT